MTDVLLASAVGMAAFVALIGGIAGALKVESQMTSKKQIDYELARALGDLLRVGRLAQTCERKIESPVNVWLECRVDLNHPPTSVATDDTVFRFGMLAGQFHWLKQTNGAFTSHLSYDFISAFEVCDDVHMQNITSGCSIPQGVISARHVSNLSATLAPSPQNRFFRFMLRWVSESGETRTLQSGFSLRHPNPSNLIYEWGQRHYEQE